MKRSIRLGLAPTRRFVFSAEDARRYKALVERKLGDWNVEFVNIDAVTPEGLLFERRDAVAATELFRREAVDAVFSPHVNFGTEEVVAQVARDVGKPFLLWGPRDESPLPDGNRLRDTQCGLFATANVLKKYRVPFSYSSTTASTTPSSSAAFGPSCRRSRLHGPSGTRASGRSAPGRPTSTR
jgi:L-fucose isomerase-like protein